MIQFQEHHQIDFDKWDACIQNSPNGIIYACSWYLNMTSPGWGALIEGDYDSVMPLPTRKKLGISYVYQPVFVQQLGVFSTQSLSQEVTLRFLEAIPAHFRWIHFNLNTFNPLKQGTSWKVKKRVTCELDLIAPYETLSEAYSTNTRRNIKKAREGNVFITRYGQPEAIIEAFRQNKGKELKGISRKHYHLLKHLVYVGIHRGLVKIRCAYTADNNFCAGVIFFKSGNKYIYLFAGLTPQARENAAMSLLVDDFIQEHSGQELILDFEGSSYPNLARFYMGFGSKECVFLQIKANRLPPVFNTIARLIENIRK